MPNIPPFVIDLVFGFLILGMTYALMSEGLWGSALMFFNVLLAGIVAFNFYEPLAALLATNATFLSGFADTLCMMSIFIVTLVILRLTTESIAPSMVRFPAPVYHLGRLVFGLAGAMVTLAIILLAFEAAPVHKKVFTIVDYKYAPPFKLGIDHQWLGFFQYTTGYIFGQNGAKSDPFGEYPGSRVFDPRAEWLLKHQDARPYGTEMVLEGGAEAAAGAAAEGGTSAGAGPGGSADSGAKPGDPKFIGVGGPGGGVVVSPP